VAAPSDRRWLSLAKADKSVEVSSVAIEPATCFTSGPVLDAKHVGKPNLSKELDQHAKE
jgi:hypothetical protein